MLFWLIAACAGFIAVEAGLSLFTGLGQHRSLLGATVQSRGTVRPPAGRDQWPRVLLIVPCKGREPGLCANLEAVADQDYPDFHLALVTATRDDGAAAAIRQVLHRRPGTATWLVAGLHARCAEKAANLRFALTGCPESEVVVTADSDGCPDRGWLRRLVARLPAPDDAPTGVTGYRWYLPEGSAAGYLQSVWNASALSLLASGRPPFVWGGATAIWRAHLDATDVAERWRTTVSDDYSLTRAIAAAGGRIVFAPGGLVPSVASKDPRTVLGWIGRQMMLTRIYAPRLWRTIGIYQGLWTAGLLGALVVTPRHPWLATPLAFAIAASMVKGGLRWSTVRRLLPDRAQDMGRRGLYMLLAPLVGPITALMALRSATTRTLRWRGVVYRLAGPERTVVVRRSDGAGSATTSGQTMAGEPR